LEFDRNSFSKQLDNTLIVLVYGDNGTSAEGGRNGMFRKLFAALPEGHACSAK
jgi:arylsulfatase A-like enzyme